MEAELGRRDGSGVDHHHRVVGAAGDPELVDRAWAER